MKFVNNMYKKQLLKSHSLNKETIYKKDEGVLRLTQTVIIPLSRYTHELEIY